jgi:hypothetical protein
MQNKHDELLGRVAAAGAIQGEVEIVVDLLRWDGPGVVETALSSGLIGGKLYCLHNDVNNGDLVMTINDIRYGKYREKLTEEVLRRCEYRQDE